MLFTKKQLFCRTSDSSLELERWPRDVSSILQLWGHLPGYQHSGNLMRGEGKGSQHLGCQLSLNSSVSGIAALFSAVLGVPKPKSLCQSLYRIVSPCLCQQGECGHLASGSWRGDPAQISPLNFLFGAPPNLLCIKWTTNLPLQIYCFHRFVNFSFFFFLTRSR